MEAIRKIVKDLVDVIPEEKLKKVFEAIEGVIEERTIRHGQHGMISAEMLLKANGKTPQRDMTFTCMVSSDENLYRYQCVGWRINEMAVVELSLLHSKQQFETTIESQMVEWYMG